VIDAKGEVVLEAKVATRPEALREIFGRMPRSRIALETGTHSPWISRLLSELGHEAIVAHARDVRLIGESRRKDDKIDAQALARLARIDRQLLSPIQHRSAEAQADLSVIRALGLDRRLASRKSPDIRAKENIRYELTQQQWLLTSTGLLMEGQRAH
jgi:transposase